MTDVYHSLTVVLVKDTRDDDAEGLVEAIKRMRGVLTVEGNVADSGSYSYEQRAQMETATLFHNLVRAVSRGGLAEVTHALEGVIVRSSS